MPKDKLSTDSLDVVQPKKLYTLFANKTQVMGHPELKDLDWKPKYVGNPNDTSDRERFKVSLYADRVYVDFTDLNHAKNVYRVLIENLFVAYKTWH